MSFSVIADSKRTTELSLKERKLGSATLEAISQEVPFSKMFVLDFIGLLFIYFVPAISHLLSVPLYFIEPMRLMVIIAMIFSSKRNTYLIALSLPVFSFLISSHPIFPKMLIMTLELGLNVWLFYLFARLMRNYFYAMLLSVVLSKGVYYLLSYMAVHMSFMGTSEVSTIPLYIQAIVTVVFSTYVFIMFSRKEALDPYIDPTK